MYYHLSLQHHVPAQVSYHLSLLNRLSPMSYLYDYEVGMMSD